MRTLVTIWFVASVAAMAGCTDPTLNTNLQIGPNGVKVSPSVSGRVGDVGVTVGP